MYNNRRCSKVLNILNKMIGIDTIRIKLDKYSVSKYATLIMNTDFNLEGEEKASGLFRLDTGEEISCKKAYLNKENFNFEILQGINGANTFVHFSIPKVISKSDNFRLVNKEETIQAINEVQNCMNSEGIKADLFKGKVSRLDVCRNIETVSSYNEYDNVLKNLQMKRAIKKEFGKKVDSHLWKNTQQEICMYDKFKEMLFNKKDVKYISDKTVRCEIRLMKTRKVSDELKFKNVENMLDNFTDLATYYRRKLKDSIFRYNVEEFQILLKNQVVTRLNYFQNHYRRNWVNEFVKCFGYLQIEKVIGLKVFESALKEVGCKRNSFHYIRKNYNKKIFENSLFAVNSNPAELYNELKYKLCEAA